MPRLSTSTWTLHRALGPSYHPAPEDSSKLIRHGEENGTITLLELPSALAERGIRTLEVCHFHFPSLDEQYLTQFRESVQSAGVELFSVLIDDGDITHPDPEQRHMETQWIRGWIEIAGKLGAGHVRVIAGKQKAEGRSVIHHSADGLKSLTETGKANGVQVITENFHVTAKRPETILEILDRCEGKVGLCVDFGNFGGETKYEDLEAILPYATSVHAKAHYPEAGKMDRADFIACMELSRKYGFDGPYSLIFDGPGNEWDSLEEIKQDVLEYL
jgi:sugar phosphate isomerase/epimerase